MGESEDKLQQLATAELTDQNRSFIFHLTNGRSVSGNPLTVYEAYQKAGYNGDKHAAYQLKSRLEKQLLATQVSEGGASKSEIFRQISDLMQLPALGKDGAPVEGISVSNKIKVLGLAVKAHEMVKAEAPKITAVQINFEDEPEKKVEFVDVEAAPKGE